MSKINYKEIMPCLLAIAIDAMGFGLVYPIMSAMFSQTDSGILSSDVSSLWRNFFLGIGYAIYPFCMFFGSSLMGDLSDFYGRKRVLAICIFGLFISYLLMGVGAVLPSVFLLILGRGLGGLMAGCQGIAQASISDLSTPETKALNMSIISVAFSAGIVIGPIMGGITTDSNISPFLNYGTPFFLTAILSLICFFWILISYHETFVRSSNNSLSLMRPFIVIIDAVKHKNIRTLSIIFFLMQIGYSLYFQMILVFLQNKYHYTAFGLGLFSGLIGIFFVVGLLVIVRLMLRVWSVYVIATIGLLAAGICQIISSLIHAEISTWILAIFIAAFDMVAYTSMLTAFSNAVTKDQQGWALGITGSVMAIAWVVTGLFANLLPIFGATGLIFIGGVFWILSFILMWIYTHRTSRCEILSPNEVIC